MTKDITFVFKKDTGSLNLHFLDAVQGTAPIAVKDDAISSAVSGVFTRLIKKNRPKYEKAILGLSGFVVTFTNGDQPSLKVVSGVGDVEIHLHKLSAKTAALFSNSIEKKDSSTEEKTRKESPKTQQPVPAAVSEPLVVQSALTTPPANDNTSAAPSLPVVIAATPPSKELTPEEQMQQIIASLMTAQFTDTAIQRSAGSESEYFGDYLMRRVFGKTDSCHFNLETHEFTLNFSKNKEILLAKLPEGKTPEQLKALEKLHGATLSIAQQVKGKFNIEKGKLTFQPGCLKLNWTWTSAELLGISQGQNNKVIMQINYLKFPTEGPVPAQDFVDIIECNLSK